LGDGAEPSTAHCNLTRRTLTLPEGADSAKDLRAAIEFWDEATIDRYYMSAIVNTGEVSCGIM
jgi:hypothetical protein